MIEVTYKDECGVLLLSLDGHAGAAEHGHDIVCASASMLAYTLGAAVLESSGSFRNTPIVSLTSGHACIACVPFPEAYERIRLCYELILRGYRMLCMRYPDYVSLISTPERV